MTALDTKALLTGVTPGPWAVTGDGRYIWTADGSDYVCDIKLAEDDPEVIANARLIASAPRLARRVIELEEALGKAERALQRMMDTWLDYHDAHSLTEPVTGASANAFDDALEARDLLAALKGEGDE